MQGRGRRSSGDPPSYGPQDHVSWLFARSLLDERDGRRTGPADDEPPNREHQNWLADVSVAHDHRRRDAEHEAAHARRQHAYLEWLAAM